MSKISIIGLGWFGESLAHELKIQHKIYGTTRSDEKVLTFNQQNIAAEKLTINDRPSDALLNADVIVLNIPPFAGQLEWFKSWNFNQQSHVIFISSISVYGNNTGEIDELTPPLPVTKNAKLLLNEEEWIQTFTNFTIIRFGGLIGPDRHPSKVLSGKKDIPGGNLPVNLIHLDDCVGFTKLVIKRKMTLELFNLVSPEHPLRRDYYKTAHFIDSKETGKLISSAKVMDRYQFLTSIN